MTTVRAATGMFTETGRNPARDADQIRRPFWCHGLTQYRSSF